MPRRARIALCLGLEKSLLERHGTGAAWHRRGMAQARHAQARHAQARHGMRESNTAALCKSNGKDTIQTLSGTAWQGNGMVCVN
jgi:hypothetical protein